MSNPSSIPAGLPVLGSGDSTAPARSSVVSHPPAAPEAKPVPLFANPSFRFDPSVGLVVIEFHNDTGGISNSIPSQRQLAAYRLHRETLPGETPPEAPPTTQKAEAPSLEARHAEARPGDVKTSAG